MSQIAVIMSGGKQYLVKAGDVLRVEKLEEEDGKKLKFDALMVADAEGKDAKIGTPTVKGASVEATVLRTAKGDKITIIKFHAKTRYKRKAGHRQMFTELKIDSIKA